MPDKSRTVGIQLTVEQFDTLSQRSEQAGRTRGDYLIDLISRGLPALLAETADNTPPERVSVFVRISEDTYTDLELVKSRTGIMKAAIVRGLFERETT